MADYSKELYSKLSNIENLMLNSVKVLLEESEKQTNALISITDILRQTNEKPTEPDATKTSEGAVGSLKNLFTDAFTEGFKTFVDILPDFFKGINEFSSADTEEFTKFISDMNKALTLDGKYDDPKKMGKFYKAVGETYELLSTSIENFSRGLIFFAKAEKLNAPKNFIKFTEKFFDKKFLKKLDPKKARKAGLAYTAMGNGILRFAISLAISTPLLIIGLPALAIALPVMMGLTAYFTWLGKFNKGIKRGARAMRDMGIGMMAFTASLAMMRYVRPEDLVLALGVIALFTVLVGAIMLLNKFTGGKMKDSAKMMIAAGIGLATFAGAIMLMQFIPEGSISTSFKVIGIFVLFMGAMMLISKLGKGKMKDNAKALLMATVSIGILAGAIMLYKFVDTEDLIKAGLSITVLSLVLFVLSKQKNVKKSAAALLITSISLGILAYTIQMFEDVEYSQIFKAGVALAVIGLAMRTIGKGSTKILKGTLALTAVSASLYVLGLSIREWKKQNIGWEDIGIIGATVAMLGVIYFIAGKAWTSILKGSLAMAAVGASMWVIGWGISEWKKQGLEWEDIAIIGATVVGLGVAYAIAGLAIAPILLGSLAMTAVGASMWVIGWGISKWKKQGLEWEDVGIIGATVAMLGVEYAIAGLAIVPIALGALAMAAIGVSMWVLGWGINKWNSHELDMEDVGVIGATVAMLGVEYAIAGLAIIPIAAGAVAMALAGASLWVVGWGLGKFLEAAGGWDEDDSKSLELAMLSIKAAFGGGGGLLSSLWATATGVVDTVAIAANAAGILIGAATLYEVSDSLKEIKTLNWTEEDSLSIEMAVATLKSAFGGGQSFLKSMGNFVSGVIDTGSAATQMNTLERSAESLVTIKESLERARGLNWTEKDSKSVELAVASVKAVFGGGKGITGAIGNFIVSSLDKKTAKNEFESLRGTGDEIMQLVEIMGSIQDLQKSKFTIEDSQRYLTGVVKAFTGPFDGGKLKARDAETITGSYRKMIEDVVKLAKHESKLGKVASHMESISNSMIDVVSAFDKLSSDKLTRSKEFFDSLVAMEKINADTFKAKLDSTKELVQSLETASNSNPVVASNAAQNDETSKRIEILENGLTIMQEMMAAIHGTLETISTTLQSNTLKVDVVSMDQDINL